MYEFFVETNPAIDEYIGQAWGVFAPKGFCILGFGRPYGQWLFILLNIGFGVWQPDD